MSMTNFLKKQDIELDRIFNDKEGIARELDSLKSRAAERSITLTRGVQDTKVFKPETKLSLNNQITNMITLFNSIIELQREKGETLSNMLILEEKFQKTKARVDELGYDEVKKDYNELCATNRIMEAKTKCSNNNN